MKARVKLWCDIAGFRNECIDEVRDDYEGKGCGEGVKEWELWRHWLFF